MTETAVVYLVREKEGIEPVKNFINSYRANRGGMGHDLLVLYKGFSAEKETAAHEALLEGLPHQKMFIPDRGYDIDAYFKALKSGNYVYFCFLNTFSVIRDDAWLLKMHSWISRDKVGLVGVTGSWESFYPNVSSFVKSEKTFREKLAIGWRWAIYFFDMKFRFDPFPNYHIRTNAFMVRKSVMEKIVRARLLRKMDAWCFESGKKGLSRQILGMGQDLVVVGKDGQGYPKEDWWRSDTFRQGQQSNLLISDNQTELYEKASPDMKRDLSASAWGTRMLGESHDPMTPPCPLCSAAASFYFQTKDLNRNITDQSFDYYRCGGCGFVFLQPVPEDLSRYYPEDYSMLPETWKQFEGWAVQEKPKLSTVQRFISSGKMLEIGPSNGAFAYLAKKAGFDMSCIEMDPKCCRFIRDTLKIPVVESDDPVAALEASGNFDAIVLWQVVEHFRDPFSVLSACVQKLRPGGWLILSAPNPDSLQFRIFKGSWTHIDAPRHVNLISSGLLQTRCEKMGLVSEGLFSDDPGGRGWNLFGWRFSLAHRFRSPLFKKAASFFGAILYPVFYYFENRPLRGSSYTAVFRRKGN